MNVQYRAGSCTHAIWLAYGYSLLRDATGDADGEGDLYYPPTRSSVCRLEA
jgi:hypothetical protein